MLSNEEPKYIMRQVDNMVYIVRDYQQEFFDDAIKDNDTAYLLRHADTVIDAEDRFVVKARKF